MNVTAAQKMPPLGVAHTLLSDVEPDSVERFHFWLLTHTKGVRGETLWRTIVLRECLPDPQGALDFTACARPLGGS